MGLLTLQNQTEDDDFALNACIENARNVTHILKAVHFKDTATVFATENGLKVTVEDSKCIQGNAFIQDQVFQEYSIRDEALTFQINLDILLECLNIFGSNNSTTTMRMMYNGYGTPLVLMLEEDGAVTDCSIRTMEAEETLDFEFTAANVVNKIIMKADCLREAFNEMDASSEVLQITMSPDPPHFRLATFGLLGQSHQDIPKNSDMVEYFECNETLTNRYRLNLLKPSVKAVNLACKVCVRVDHRGFLSLQHMIKNENGQICFVEYYCCPDEEFDEPAT
uniref:Cell cycle checkpoint protein RAD1 n=1 Tax=Ciona intestinalis TaxID=7719 RepID=F6XMX2_CIOIN